MSALNDEDRENLGAFLDGELDEDAARVLEAKINIDPEARKELDALKHVQGLLDYLPQPQPSPNFTNRTLEKLSLGQVAAHSESGGRPTWRTYLPPAWLGWTAAALLAVVAGFSSQRLFTKPPAEDEITDETLVHYLRIVENWQTYDKVDNVEFLRSLDRPDLFGNDRGS